MPSLKHKRADAHTCKSIRKAIVTDKTSTTRARSKEKDKKPRGHEKGKKLGTNQKHTDEALKDLKDALKALLIPAPGTKRIGLGKVVAAYGGRVMRDTLHQFSKRVKERPAAEWSAAIENIKWDDAGKQGAPHVNARRIFDDADEEFLCASVSVFFELGFPKDKAALADVAKVAADKMRLKDPETGEPYTCSERFVEGLLDHKPLGIIEVS